MFLEFCSIMSSMHTEGSIKCSTLAAVGGRIRWQGRGMSGVLTCQDQVWNGRLSSGACIYICTSAFTFYSFIHSEYFYSASSSQLLLRGAPGHSNCHCVDVYTRRLYVVCSRSHK